MSEEKSKEKITDSESDNDAKLIWDSKKKCFMFDGVRVKYICRDCAFDWGASPHDDGLGSTCHSGTCPVCKEEWSVCAPEDFKWDGLSAQQEEKTTSISISAKDIVRIPELTLKPFRG